MHQIHGHPSPPIHLIRRSVQITSRLQWHTSSIEPTSLKANLKATVAFHVSTIVQPGVFPVPVQCVASLEHSLMLFWVYNDKCWQDQRGCRSRAFRALGLPAEITNTASCKCVLLCRYCSWKCQRKSKLLCRMTRVIF